MHDYKYRPTYSVKRAVYLYACKYGIKHGVTIVTFTSQSKQYNRERECVSTRFCCSLYVNQSHSKVVFQIFSPFLSMFNQLLTFRNIFTF